MFKVAQHGSYLKGIVSCYLYNCPLSYFIIYLMLPHIIPLYFLEVQMLTRLAFMNKVATDSQCPKSAPTETD